MTEPKIVADLDEWRIKEPAEGQTEVYRRLAWFAQAFPHLIPREMPVSEALEHYNAAREATIRALKDKP